MCTYGETGHCREFEVYIMALSDAEKRKRRNQATAESLKKNTKAFLLRYSYSTDGKLIDYLERLPNKAGYIRDLVYADMAAIRREHRTRVIPLFGNSFAAGPGEPDFSVALEEYEIPENQRGDFAVRVNGDSMEPWLPDGSIQIGVREMPKDGEVAAVMVDGAFYIKQVCIDITGTLHLFSLNRERKNLDFSVEASSNSTVRCFGTILTRERHRLPLD